MLFYFGSTALKSLNHRHNDNNYNRDMLYDRQMAERRLQFFHDFHYLEASSATFV